jgi:hypothetical protein
MQNFNSNFSILNAYIFVTERSIAFKHTLEPPSDTFEVFGKPGKKLKFDLKSKDGTKGTYTGYNAKFSF